MPTIARLGRLAGKVLTGVVGFRPEFWKKRWIGPVVGGLGVLAKAGATAGGVFAGGIVGGPWGMAIGGAAGYAAGSPLRVGGGILSAYKAAAGRYPRTVSGLLKTTLIGGTVAVAGTAGLVRGVMEATRPFRAMQYRRLKGGPATGAGPGFITWGGGLKTRGMSANHIGATGDLVTALHNNRHG